MSPAGAGGHTNFSSKSTRADGTGWDAIQVRARGHLPYALNQWYHSKQLLRTKAASSCWLAGERDSTSSVHGTFISKACFKTLAS